MTLQITGQLVRTMQSTCTYQMIVKYFDKCPNSRMKTKEKNFLSMN